jgi:hypothetical protein
MELKDIIQNEYYLFRHGKLLFELIYPDSYTYLYDNGFLKDNDKDEEAAILAIRNYRQIVLRGRWKEQLDPIKALRLPTPEIHRETENRYRALLVRKLLVYQWYAEQLEKGMENVLETKYICSL